MADAGFCIGMRVITNPLAVIREKHADVVRTPVRKRRRNWLVRITWTETPAAYKLGAATLVVHPSIYEKMKKEFSL